MRNAQAGGRVAGIRTYALLGLAGGICGLAAISFSPWFGLLGLTGLIVALGLAHRARLKEPDDNISATDAVVSILTLMLGLTAAVGYAKEAVIAGGVATLILSMREQLHGWLQTLSEKDMRAAAQYGAITLVVLPLLPDRGMGPYDALNPRSLWLVVVFVTGLSFAGYWASKKFGQARGTILAAAIGATFSSTAVTLEISRRLRKPGENIASLNASIAAATAVMPIRVMLVCAVLMPRALGHVTIGLGAAILFTALYTIVATLRASRPEVGAGVGEQRNPFDFWPAIGFAVAVAAIILLSHWTIDQFEGQGMTVMIIGLTGLYDVDAAIIAASQLPSASITPAEMGVIATLPILVNTLLKGVMVLVVAGWQAGRVAVIPLFCGALLIGGSMIWLAQQVF